MHCALSPNYKRLKHREVVALHFHDLGIEHEIERVIFIIMASYSMHRTDYCIIQMEKTHFHLVVSSISSKSAQYFT